MPRFEKLRSRIAPEKIVKTVAAATGSSPDAIVTKGRKRNQSREIAIYLSLQFCALPCVEPGRYFGGISGSAISLRGKRCAMKTEKDKALRGVIEKIRGQIVDS